MCPTLPLNRGYSICATHTDDEAVAHPGKPCAAQNPQAPTPCAGDERHPLQGSPHSSAHSRTHRTPSLEPVLEDRTLIASLPVRGVLGFCLPPVGSVVTGASVIDQEQDLAVRASTCCGAWTRCRAPSRNCHLQLLATRQLLLLTLPPLLLQNQSRSIASSSDGGRTPDASIFDIGALAVPSDQVHYHYQMF